MSPHQETFLKPNVSSVTLNLGAWQSGGCPIKHFVVQHRPKYLSQWTTITDDLEVPRDFYVIRHLSPDRDYVVMVTAHSDAGMTQGEYLFRTLPTSAIGTLFETRINKKYFSKVFSIKQHYFFLNLNIVHFNHILNLIKL